MLKKFNLKNVEFSGSYLICQTLQDNIRQNEACYKDFMCKYLFLQLYKKSKAKAFK